MLRTTFLTLSRNLRIVQFTPADFVKFKYPTLFVKTMQRGVMNRKAQGLPITTIIIAILGIAVLVILFAILTGRLTIFSATVAECPGTCVVDSLLGRPGGFPGLVEVRTSDACEPGTERELFGIHIARNVRLVDNVAVSGKGAAKGKPISCDRCCISV